ncbi:MAG: adenylate/guanylate cyclase domain-containing protein [Gallionella sp.]|jgi:adenylate cyclase|nr:adenylate/guanylate cyclase domain-containing protein [Gallionella sp.]MCK9355216.1 adenylate/guanylate cyclase domain-containing protein [Gallionella sp.]
MSRDALDTKQKRLAHYTAFLLRALLPAVLIVAALVVQFADPQFRARIRDNAFDQLQSFAPLPYRDELPVRVIAIDDDSLARIGQWPWPRTVLADIIDRLTAMGARVVALDIVLSEPDRTSPEQVAAAWPKQPALQALLGQIPEHDKILAASFTRNKVAIGFPIEAVASSSRLPPVKARFLNFGGNAGDWLPHYGGGLASLPLLTNAASGSGAISREPGSDGVMRNMPLLYRVKNTLYPGLSLEALRLFGGQDNLALQVAKPETTGQVPGIMGIGLGKDIFLPTAPDGQVWIHFRPLATERYVSAIDLLEGKIDPQRVKDHIVFVGATAKGLGDTIYSPLDELIPGIEGHVQLTEQLLTGETLSRPAWENDLLVATLLGAWLLLGFMLHRYRPIWSVLLTVLVVAGLFLLSLWLFVSRHLLLDPSYPALAVSSLFIVMMVPRYLRTEWEQRWIKKAFSRYVSPNRVKFLQENPQQLELGSVYRECSFVMTDLEGFTPLMEKSAPNILSDLLNEYLEGLIQVAFRHDGTLDRIVGDAVVVMFSAPLIQADHAARALACALEMDAFAQECSSRQQGRGIPFGKTRIGVNTGTVLIGNFGGKTMLDYRALGDPINTAARLESINKQLGTRICVSEATVAQCPEFIGRPSGHLVLKGKTIAVATFEPLTAEQAAQPHIAEYLAAYALMETESPAAKEAFLDLAKKYPEDPLAVYHAKRLAAGESGSRVVITNK